MSRDVPEGVLRLTQLDFPSSAHQAPQFVSEQASMILEQRESGDICEDRINGKKGTELVHGKRVHDATAHPDPKQLVDLLAKRKSNIIRFKMPFTAVLYILYLLISRRTCM